MGVPYKVMGDIRYRTGGDEEMAGCGIMAVVSGDNGIVNAIRWGAYVEQRLSELERGEGDYTELQQPSAATVTRARKVAAETFRDTTPTPSVVPTAEGGIDFVWHKNGYDVEICVTEFEADIWARQRATGDEWASPLPDHDRYCIPHVLDALEG